MKIAVLAPTIERVPPIKYGGTELVISLLVEGLVSKGHDVTLFASGDSLSSAKIIPLVKKSIRSDSDIGWPFDHFMSQTLAADIAEEYILDNDFDVVHNHMDYHGLSMSKRIRPPVVTTFHGSLNSSLRARYLLRHNNESHFISISNNQRRFLPELKWLETVYNGIELANYPFNANPKGEYFLFLSRISSEKGPLEAIEAAKKLGKKLIMASKVDVADQVFFKKYVKPKIDGKEVIFLGEVSHNEKVKLYQNANAYLFPIKWPEPFGLTMVEAMACGAPVVAFGLGAVPEVIENNVSGFVCSNLEEMIRCLKKTDSIKRENTNKRAQFFSKENMVENYIKAFKKALILKPSVK